MWLLLDVKGREPPDWEGFQFLVNREAASDAETSLERCVGGWRWEGAGTVPYRVEGNEMHIVVPRDALGIPKGRFVVEFKWLDNVQEPGDILDAYVHGDAAPGGRFRYRYEGR